MIRGSLKWLLLAGLALASAACMSVDYRAKQAATLDPAIRAGWTQHLLAATPMSLVALTSPVTTPHDTLTVYFEGDGLAWLSASTPSTDPTPIHAIGLHLALADPSPLVAYLARPCQYRPDTGCQRRYWTSHRFSPDVIAASDAALTQLKAQSGANTLVLVGYSGGAAVAALVAARRHDVSQLISVAGNLDPEAWVQAHDLSPLMGSLNPADAWQALQHLPQVHFIGANDTVVPPAIAASYRQRFPSHSPLRLVLMPGFDHQTPWVERWPELIEKYRPKKSPPNGGLF